MRILIVYRTRHHLEVAAYPMGTPDIHVGPNARVRITQSYFTVQGLVSGGSIDGLVVGKPGDLEQLKGMHYDVVIEDGSFEMDPAHGWGQYFAEQGIRQSSPWACWRSFLRIHVLR